MDREKMTQINSYVVNPCSRTSNYCILWYVDVVNPCSRTSNYCILWYVGVM